ncbi:hypothetical protein JMJ77_0005716 [Colletotrichum scovillei]|uniref:Uncharacterized protein n=1 Tax=Colletotrichum scovillei TaxID=1209932 RepID=A0A9P7RHS2_9PEZI|nr:hypothetical protein JMJ77_0005716 [Colletotrichum scovillei]KAG7076940.1 hypothetical protein JMJ76_0014196 [Colletotrichum scovillei]KAG7084075.1 hypothetical protein JMJ78_0009515 [Colletotrichum scovillei]
MCCRSFSNRNRLHTMVLSVSSYFALHPLVSEGNTGNIATGVSIRRLTGDWSPPCFFFLALTPVAGEGFKPPSKVHSASSSVPSRAYSGLLAQVAPKSTSVARSRLAPTYQWFLFNCPSIELQCGAGRRPVQGLRSMRMSGNPRDHEDFEL